MDRIEVQVTFFGLEETPTDPEELVERLTGDAAALLPAKATEVRVLVGGKEAAVTCFDQEV